MHPGKRDAGRILAREVERIRVRQSTPGIGPGREAPYAKPGTQGGVVPIERSSVHAMGPAGGAPQKVIIPASDSFV